MRTVREAAVAGVYQSRQGDFSGVDQAALWWECARAACADAGLTLADVDGVVGTGPDGVGIRDKMPGAALGYDLLGKPLRFHAAASIGAGSTAAALNHAVNAVGQGLAEVVLIVNAVAGNPAGYASANRDTAVAAMAKLGGPYEYVYGTTRVADYAVLAQRHMYEFGTTSEQLAQDGGRSAARRHPAPAVDVRRAGRADGGGGGRLTHDRRSVAHVRLLRDQPGRRRGRRHRRRRRTAHGRTRRSACWATARATATSTRTPRPAWPTSRPPRLPPTRRSGMAGVDRDDIDVAGIGDHFTINVIFGIEAAGFCKLGEGGLLRRERRPQDRRAAADEHRGWVPVVQPRRHVRVVHADRGRRAAAGPRRRAAGRRNAKYGYVNGVGGAMQNNFSAILGEV